MSDWITDKPPTLEDSHQGVVWVSHNGLVVQEYWEHVTSNKPWQPIVRPEPYEAPEPVKEYWSKPSHFPPACWIWDKTAAMECYLVTRPLTFLNNISYKLEEFRWMPHPFDNFEDGKECLVEGETK